MPKITTISLPPSYKPPVPKRYVPDRKARKALRKARNARRTEKHNGRARITAYKADYVDYLSSEHWKALSGRIRDERAPARHAGAPIA